MTTVLLDTHAVHWWSAEPDRLSKRARSTIDRADELAVAAISWYELAWLAQHQRIRLTVPLRTWLDRLADLVYTAGITPAIAARAATLPAGFPGDPADRLIYATAVEEGWPLVTKDEALRRHRPAGATTLW